MRITYDSRANAAYVTVGEKKGDIETHELSDDVLVDLNEDGSIYGIELLNATTQLSLTDDGFVTMIDAQTGGEVRLKVSRAKDDQTAIEPA